MKFSNEIIFEDYDVWDEMSQLNHNMLGYHYKYLRLS